MVATWGHPWRQLGSLSIPPEVSFSRDISRVQADGLAGYTSLKRICSKVGLQSLEKLPQELLDMILEYAEPCALLRYSTVLCLAELLSLEEQGSMSAVCPMGRITSWHRGYLPNIKDEDENKATFVRLTIDCRGLRRIDQLSSPTEESSLRSGCLFSVERIDCLSSVTAQFRVSSICTLSGLYANINWFQKLGFCCLNLPPDIADFRVWDTPFSPTLEGSLSLTPSLAPLMRIATIQTRFCFGLTFFVSFGGIRAIHAHTPRAPCALDTLQQLPFRSQPYALWIYMPIASEDSILAFGLRFQEHGQDFGGKTPSFLVSFFFVTLLDMSNRPRFASKTQVTY